MLPSTALDWLYTKIQELGKTKIWFLFLVFVFLLVTLINGVGIVPEEPYQRLSENPFITRTDIHFNNYWQENPLLPVIAFYLGLTSADAFNILCFVILIGAYSLFALLSSRRWGPTQALIFSTLLITSPLTTILLSWVGTPDGLTVALTVPILFTSSVPLVFILSVLGIINHPAFMITVIEILVLRWAAKDNVKFWHVLFSVFGLMTGYGLIRLFLTANQIEIVSRTDFMLLKDMSEWLKMNALNLPMSLSSLFNIHLLILILCLFMYFKRDRIFYSLALAFLLVNYVFTFFTLDTTRIFSLLSWGVLVECMFHSLHLARTEQSNNPDAEKQFLRSLILIGIISFFTPRYFSWAGEIHTTPFYQFLRKVFR